MKSNEINGKKTFKTPFQYKNIVVIDNKKLCTIFYYAIAVFSFLANLDFFLAAEFLTRTPFVQA